MPDLNDLGERSIEAALVALSAALGSTGVGWMIIGGIAVIAHGVRRMTTDIDAVVQGDALADEPDLERGLESIIARVQSAQRR